MSHSCPECGMACYCSGDIEDHDTGEEYTTRCTCCADRDNSADDCDDRDWPIDLSSVTFGKKEEPPTSQPDPQAEK